MITLSWYRAPGVSWLALMTRSIDVGAAENTIRINRIPLENHTQVKWWMSGVTEINLMQVVILNSALKSVLFLYIFDFVLGNF